mgnify:FL=1
MDLSITTDAYGAFPHSEQDVYAVVTSGNLEPSLYSEAVPGYVLSNQTSPCLYPEDGDMRLSSSSLSTPSSAAGSPQSNPGHLGSVDWTNSANITLQPSIVGSDYMADYPTFPGAGVDDFATFDFTHAKSYVGKFFLSFTFFPFPCLPCLPFLCSSPSLPPSHRFSWSRTLATPLFWLSEACRLAWPILASIPRQPTLVHFTWLLPPLGKPFLVGYGVVWRGISAVVQRTLATLSSVHAVE